MKKSVVFLTFAMFAGTLLPAHADYAVAWGQSGTRYWYSWTTNKKTQADARQQSMTNCQKNGKECRIITAGSKQCLAIAVPQKADAAAYWQTRFLKGDAERAATAVCEAKRGKCIVKVAFCDEYVKP